MITIRFILGRCLAALLRPSRTRALYLALALAGAFALPAESLGQTSAAAQFKAQEVINFALIDHRGQCRELRRVDARVVVLFFTANGCPIARHSIEKLKTLRTQYRERGVTIWMINSCSQDDRDGIVKEAEEFRAETLPILKDDTQGVAGLLGVRRTCETIAIDTKDWTVFYRGAIDDQFTEGAQKPEAKEKFLETALEEFLAGKRVSKPQTLAKGCRIHFEAEADSGGSQISFVKDVTPILVRKCVGCHSPGGLGPWAMSSYKKVKGMSAMMQEVILTRRMPPWGADPHFGKFANDRSLTVAEAQTLLGWIEQGAPRGEGEDPLPNAARPAEDWPLGKPDYVLRFPKPEEIPATGVLEFRYIGLDSPFTNDVWLGAVAVKPGNRRIVHHVTLYAVYRGEPLLPGGLSGWAPGYTAWRFPEGTGKKVRKGGKFGIEMHYTTIGTPQSDETEVGLYLLPTEPSAALETRAVFDTDLSIPAGEPNLKSFTLAGFDEETWLHVLTPHMHRRGAWFKYELLHPNGQRETLLSVPRYDFDWQSPYILAEPKRVTAGSWLLCTGGFDNSIGNPANPDPGKRVRWGEQSWDEMFIGAFSVAPAPKAPALSRR